MQKNLSFCIERKVGVKISPLESQISLDTGRNIIYISYVHLTKINSISKSCQINQISKIFRGAIAFAVLLFQIPDCNCGVATGEKYQRMFTFERTETERMEWKKLFSSSELCEERCDGDCWIYSSMSVVGFLFYASRTVVLRRLTLNIITIPKIVGWC